MSSGEKAKPPATFEERNPFDISRRSGPEVAAEIAKRMVAWKQARSRTSVPSSTIPSDEAKAKSAIANSAIVNSSGAIAKSPPIAAPVQPARMPKSTAPATTPAERGAGNSALRVPFFASASATRRAMPPAPSLKQGIARPPAGDGLAERADEPAVQIAAPALEQESLRHDESTAEPEALPTESSSVSEPAVEAVALEPEAPEISAPVESPLAAKTAQPASAETEDDDRRRAEARAIKARWIAARDLDELIDTSGKAAKVEAATAAAHETAAGEANHEPQAAAGTADNPLPDEKPDEATDPDELLLDEPAEPEHDTPEIAAATHAPTAAPEQAGGRWEPTFDAPSADAAPAPIADRDVAKDVPALDLAALDEISGRREPTFDTPLPRAAPRNEVADEPRMQPIAIAVAEPVAVADEALSIAALDEVAGRREPTFDEPVQRKALKAEPPAAVETQAETKPDAPNAASGAAPVDSPAVGDSSQRDIAALDEAAGRKEPTFDEPVRPAKPAAAQTPAPRIKLRPIETRIEARRVDTLRAEPQLSARRPIFPHIEPDEWDMPPVVAARANRERRGTSWAIGLGTVLLIAGITAPAAIWQQGRQGQDQAGLVSPPPAPQQAAAPAATTNAQQQSQAPAQATLPEAPQPETPAPVPAVTAQQSGAPSAPDVAALKPEAEQAAADPQPTTTLGPIDNGVSVNEAPVMAPRPPMVNLASKAPAPSGTNAPMVARPFVPEGGAGPFLRAPTTGATSVPVAGAPAQSAAVGVKPSLMVQLKPAATAKVSAAKPVANKPRPASRQPKPFFQQSPEQMFETLIDTLSEGKPVNPATKPASPSHRR